MASSTFFALSRNKIFSLSLNHESLNKILDFSLKWFYEIKNKDCFINRGMPEPNSFSY